MKLRGIAISSVLVSAPWTWNFGDPPAGLDGVQMRLLRRSSDWGLSKSRARRRMFADAVALAREAPECDVVVLSTMGAEAALVAALIKVRSRATRVMVFDFLAPRSQPAAPCARMPFGSIDRFLVIRSGDVAMLKRRFGVRGDRCYFLPWPVRADQVPLAVSEDGYVYSAGWAHRDWPTLIAALDQAGLRAKLAPGRDMTVPLPSRQRIEVLDMPSPEIGRELAARASVIAVVTEDTDLPSGPLVLLDSMAMGKAVVATKGL